MMDSLFFIASKVIWGALRPENWLLALLVLAGMALWRGRSRGAGRFLGAGLLGFILVGLLPLGDLLLRPLETAIPRSALPDQITGIVVLGGAEAPGLSAHWGQPVVGDSAERLLATADLARRYPDARVIFAGGSGALFPGSLTEAQVAAQILAQAGLGKDRVELEERSRNTAENAKLAKLRAAPTPDQTWVLVTSAAHMPRALGVFCAQDWAVLPYPVDPRSGPLKLEWDLAKRLHMLNAGLREWLGLTVYWASGRSTAVLPQTC